MTNLLMPSAFELASFGLKVVPLHTVDLRGTCSCGCRKISCRSRGKHPRIGNWQHLATDDEDTIGAWWDKWPRANIGILWGPRSNAVDIEFDDDQGRASADKYLGGAITPSYESGRSVHRIFRYTSQFAGLGGTKKGERVEHLEFRIGADAKGAQSVAPPSRHYSGRLYTWLPGLSISDVPIADPPAALIELLLRWYAQQVNGTECSKPSAQPLAEKIPHGQRQIALTSLAGTMRRRGLVKEEILPSLLAVAERRCESVQGDEIDVEAIAESVCRYEPGDPILRNTSSLFRQSRQEALKHLHPAIRRARLKAADRRTPARRRKR